MDLRRYEVSIACRCIPRLITSSGVLTALGEKFRLRPQVLPAILERVVCCRVMIAEIIQSCFAAQQDQKNIASAFRNISDPARACSIALVDRRQAQESASQIAVSS
jgi:hypothetical protein